MERINKHRLWLPKVSKCFRELSSAKWISSMINMIFDTVGIVIGAVKLAVEPEDIRDWE